MTPAVSAIIPVFNRQTTGLEAIASIQAQRGPPSEIIVVDDGSSPPFDPAHAAEGPSLVRVLRHRDNAGAAAARNTGIKAASGRWIAFLDSDDLWYPGKLAAQVAFAEQGLASGWPPLTCFMTSFRQISLVTGSSESRNPIDSWAVTDFAAGCWFAPGTTALVPVEAFEKIGLFDAALSRLEDLDWYLRLALAGGGTASLKTVLADVRVGAAASAAKVDMSTQYLRSKWLAADANKLAAEAARNLAAYLALEQAKAQFGSRHYLKFSRSLIRSFILRPRTQLPLRNWWHQ